MTRRAFQIPFLVPLVLALAVLYVAASLINGERDRLEKRESVLDAREKDVRTVDDARVTKLESLTLDLVKQLRAEKPASGADAASAAKTASAGKAPSAPKP